MRKQHNNTMPLGYTKGKIAVRRSEEEGRQREPSGETGQKGKEV